MTSVGLFSLKIKNQRWNQEPSSKVTSALFIALPKYTLLLVLLNLFISFESNEHYINKLF